MTTSHGSHPDRKHPLCPGCGVVCELGGEQLAGHSLFLCRACGLRSALEAFELPVNYDKVYAGGLYPDQTIEQMRQNEQNGLDAALMDTYAPFFRLLKAAPGRNTLLDVGCGGGRFCRAAARRGWKTLGIDISEVALQYARAIEPLEYRSLSAAEIAGHCGQFDVITAFEVVEHQSNIREFLKHIRAGLREDGRFLCTVPAWEHPEVRNATRPDWVPPVHLLFFTRASLQAVLRLNGFEVLKTGAIPMPSPGTLGACKGVLKRVLKVDQAPLGIWALGKPARSL